MLVLLIMIVLATACLLQLSTRGYVSTCHPLAGPAAVKDCSLALSLALLLVCLSPSTWSAPDSISPSLSQVPAQRQPINLLHEICGVIFVAHHEQPR